MAIIPYKAFLSLPLSEKCPNTEFFWSVFSFIWTEEGKDVPEKTLYFEIFHAVSNIGFSTHISKFDATSNWIVFGLVIPLKYLFFGER